MITIWCHIHASLAGKMTDCEFDIVIGLLAGYRITLSARADRAAPYIKLGDIRGMDLLRNTWPPICC